jgi:hypothetical protein
MINRQFFLNTKKAAPTFNGLSRSDDPCECVVEFFINSNCRFGRLCTV